MDAFNRSLWVIALLVLFLGFEAAFGEPAAKADAPKSQSQKTVKAVRTFPYKALQNILLEANQFLGDLKQAKKSTDASNAKLEEFRNALSEKTNKSTVAVFLPQGWDKKTIVDALNKALANQKHLDELADKFNDFQAEIEDLRGLKPTKNRIKEPSELVPSNSAAVFPNSLDNNSTLMGKLIGFVKTGRRLGSLQLSDLNPCVGGCEKWSKGLDSLKSFLSKGPSRLSELFENFATLRRISEESSSPIKVDDQKIKVQNKTKLISPKSSKQDSTKEPVDYFDFYYNHDDSSSASKKKKSQGPPPAPAGTKKQSSATTPAAAKKSDGGGKSTNKPRALGDYVDYYYNQGIPVALSNRSKINGE